MTPGIEPHPIQLVVLDDLRRARLTVLFRLLLVVPHAIWLSLWAVAASVALLPAWLATLFAGRMPQALHGFLASFARYSVHVAAYVSLASAPYPGFTGGRDYPVDVEIAPAAFQNRWLTGFRGLFALPPLLLAYTLPGGLLTMAALLPLYGALVLAVGALTGVSVLVWPAALIRGKAPEGLRDLLTYGIGYGAQAVGYALLLTDRYPSAEPRHVRPPRSLPGHPVRVCIVDDLRRPRLLVLFRLPLATPHLVWLLLWSVPAAAAAVVAWVCALVLGRVPLALHRFLAAYVRYGTHVVSFLYLVGRPFPGFVGRQGSYPTEIEIEPPQAQGRLGVLVRGVLAVPALLVTSTLYSPLLVAAMFGWLYALVTGRMPRGLRDLGAAIVRYNAQTLAYLFLVTGRYPFSSPALVDGPHPDEQLTLDLIAGPDAHTG